MTEGDKKRFHLFKKYSQNLKLVSDMGLLNGLHLKYDETFICPICTDQFPIGALDTKLFNHLTLEDAPPKSVGGKANVLTCKSCNNYCGQTIDWHLLERLTELDRMAFNPNSEFYAKFLHEEIYVQGKIKIDKYGEMSAFHSQKKNDPKKLDSYINKVGKDSVINIELAKSKVDSLKLQFAILKAGYILMFAKYGYSFILNSSYDLIRQQLLNPEKHVYVPEFWVQAPYPEEYHGVPFITEKGIEGIMSIFKVSTPNTSRTFSTIFPLPGRSPEEPMASMKKRFKKMSNFYMNMDQMGPNVDYLENRLAIKKMIDWISTK